MSLLRLVKYLFPIHSIVNAYDIIALHSKLLFAGMDWHVIERGACGELSLVVSNAGTSVTWLLRMQDDVRGERQKTTVSLVPTRAREVRSNGPARRLQFLFRSSLLPASAFFSPPCANSPFAFMEHSRVLNVERVE
jgi:hypothetical protein